MTRKEAIDRIKDMHSHMLFTEDREALETLIPELRESEDERIRKAILGLTYLDGIEPILTKCSITAGDIRTYLEKQKENIEKEYVFRPLAGTDITVAAEQAIRRANEGDRLVLAFNGAYIPVRKGCNANKIVDIYDAFIEKQKEQKPEESISQLTVQGKGVYKICPRCKERMVRDDSKVYTSIPPKYGYNCPKCGDMEFDTVMYDNPEMEEQKPWKVGANAYFTPEQKPAEWSEEDEERCMELVSLLKDAEGYLKEHGNMFSYNPMLLRNWLKSLRPSWRPSEEQMEALNVLNLHGDLSYVGQQNQLISLYQDLKKLM